MRKLDLIYKNVTYGHTFVHFLYINQGTEGIFLCFGKLSLNPLPLSSVDMDNFQWRSTVHRSKSHEYGVPIQTLLCFTPNVKDQTAPILYTRSNNNFCHTHSVKEPQRGNNLGVLYFSLVFIFLCPTSDLIYFIVSHILSKPNKKFWVYLTQVNEYTEAQKAKYFAWCHKITKRETWAIRIRRNIWILFANLFHVIVYIENSLYVMHCDQRMRLLRPEETSTGSPATPDPAQSPQGLRESIYGHPYNPLVAPPHASMQSSWEHLFHSSYIIRKSWNKEGSGLPKTI